MRKFTEILAIAVGRKGSIEKVEASIPAPLSPQHLSAVPGDRWLSQMTQNIFRAGFNRQVINSKWPAFEEAFAEEFGEAPPEELNVEQVFTIVAASVDPATERIVRFLNEGFGVPVNVVFFRHFEDGGSSYLARTWLVDHETPAVAAGGTAKAKKSREQWNGRDWYVSFGEYHDGRQWADAIKYGFVSAGGDKWYSRTMKNLEPGARIFVCIPKVGYVGVGTVLAAAKRFDEATVEIDGVEAPLADQSLVGSYGHDGDEDDNLAEWVVPVAWDLTVPREQGVWKVGMFANQNSACRLSQQFTIDQVTAAFGLED